MVKKPIAIASGDWHIRYSIQNKVVLPFILKGINTIYDAAKALRVPVIFTGDIGQSEKSLPNIVFQALMEFFPEKEKENIVTIGIDGNHDQHESCTIKNPSTGYFSGLSKGFRTVKCINFGEYFDTSHFTMYYGIPYLSNDVELESYLKKLRVKVKRDKKRRDFIRHILVWHGDLPDAQDTDNIEVGTSIIADYGMFRGFDLVLAGHIHKYQVLQSNVIMVGSIMHQRRTDIGCQMGYVVIYDDLSHDFIPLNGLPIFREYDPDKESPSNDHDFWIPIRTVEITGKEDEKKSTININNKTKLARTYCKKNGIASKRKVKTLINIIKQTEE